MYWVWLWGYSSAVSLLPRTRRAILPARAALSFSLSSLPSWLLALCLNLSREAGIDLPTSDRIGPGRELMWPLDVARKLMERWWWPEQPHACSLSAMTGQGPAPGPCFSPEQARRSGILSQELLKGRATQTRLNGLEIFEGSDRPGTPAPP